MYAEDHDIATIEQYLTGRLEAAEAAQFEAQLAADETLQADTAQYQRLFDGFHALRALAFADKVAGWEADAMLTENELEFAPVLDGLAALRSEQLRSQMTGWEAAHPAETKAPAQKEAVIKTLRPNWSRRIAIAASFLLLLGAGLSWYATSTYNSDSLVANYYRTPNIGNTMGGEQNMRSRLDTRFTDAHRLMQEKNWSQALIVFGEVLNLSRSAGLDASEMRYYSDQVSLNRVLILLGQNASEEEIYAGLDRVINDPQNEYRSKAIALKAELQSFWRKLAW